MLAGPPPKKRRVWLWVLLGILAVFLILLVACGTILGSAVKSAAPTDTSTTESGGASSEDPTSPASNAPTEKAEAKTAQIGDTVKAGDWQFKVTDFDCGHSSVGDEYLNKKAQGQFCFLKINAKNNGDDEGTLDGDSQKLTDDDGKTYSSDTEAALYEDPNDTLFLKGVNPGNTAKGLIVFDVPKKTKITEVSLTGGLFDGDVKVSLR